ncbi:acyltransferase family protein [Sphingomonas trueperi]|uniref:acyltransferase family protein n=1 Tax=Sphingomonas trueperi TaxID=53317 RepID=UPI000F26EC12
MAIERTDATLWSIQYLRAAAAVGVIVFHQMQMRHRIFGLGEHGVDLFFVISGFIMVALTDARPTRPRTFLLDRIARIVPPYWIATLCAFLVAAVDPYFYHGSTDPGLLAKSLFFVPARNAFGEIEPTLFLGWTLNYEMFFYAVFALTLFLPRGRLVVLCTLFGALVAIGRPMHPTGAATTIYTDPLLLEFAAGAILGRVFGAGAAVPASLRQVLAALAVALVLTLLAFWSGRLLFGAVAVVLVAGGLLLERGGAMPRLPWLKLLGDASFAIYLFQQFAFVLVGKSLALTGRLLHHAVPHLLIEALNIVAAIALGLLVLRLLERPLTKTVKEALRRLSGEPVGLRAAA